MKKYTLKFSNIYLLICGWITIFLLFSSCSTTYYVNGETFYNSSIDSYGQYNLNGKKFFIESGMNDVSETDLQFKEFKNIVAKSFIRKGAIATNIQNDADIIVLLQYGISDPKTYHEIIPIPIWDRTSIASSSTTTNSTSNSYGSASGNVSSSGGMTSGSVHGSSSTNNNSTSSTQYNYNYGITGIYNQNVNYTIYLRYCNIYAYDNKTKSNEMLWKTSISSNGSSGDLRETFPYLIFTGMDYYGINSGKMVKLCAKSNNSVNLLINTKIETNPYLIYSPKHSSNDNNTFITEVGFYSNATRIHFRTIGNYGLSLMVSKKTTLMVNGKEYIITGTNSVFRPNEIAFEATGQVYDFYMDFPPLNIEEIKTMRVFEPESDGWDFSIQLK